MEDLNKLVRTILVLIVIFAAIGWVSSYKTDLEAQVVSPLNEETLVIAFEGKKKIPQKNVIVDDRFVGSVSSDSNVIAVSKNGNAYQVRDGVVLVDSMVVNSDSNSVIWLD